MMASQKVRNTIVDAINTLAFQLFLQLEKQNNDQNVFISPLSITLALALLYNGANGTTQQEIADLLGISRIDLADVNSTFAAIKDELEHHRESVQLVIANSLWVQNGLQLNDNFVQTSKKFYAAEVANLDFASSQAVERINTWIDQNTDGKISKFFQSQDLDADTILVLINAIYFQGIWKHQFDAANTQQDTFLLSDGQSKPLPMMSRSGTYQYFEDRNFQAIALPYGDSNIRMMIFLPAKPISLHQFQQSLNAKQWRQWKSQFSTKPGRLVLPRFKIDYQDSLIPTLKALGLKLALSDRASYQNLCDEPAFISDIKHQAVMEINEQGTKAAAVTSVVMQRSIAQSFRMVVNRPFFCAIQDDNTGAILFLGAIREPHEC